MTLLAASQADLERFMSYVEVLPSGCWFWTGARSRGSGNRRWYGSFWLPGYGAVRAHRFSCEVIGGKPCPPGHHRDHSCCFSLCVCPTHLDVVPHAENQRLKLERRASRADAMLHAVLTENRACRTSTRSS